MGLPQTSAPVLDAKGILRKVWKVRRAGGLAGVYFAGDLGATLIGMTAAITALGAIVAGAMPRSPDTAGLAELVVDCPH